eukprot:351585-Chlamydomonas_euryale.AAC.9
MAHLSDSKDAPEVDAPPWLRGARRVGGVRALACVSVAARHAVVCTQRLASVRATTSNARADPRAHVRRPSLCQVDRSLSGATMSVVVAVTVLAHAGRLAASACRWQRRCAQDTKDLQLAHRERAVAARLHRCVAAQ